MNKAILHLVFEHVGFFRTTRKSLIEEIIIKEYKERGGKVIVFSNLIQ